MKKVFLSIFVVIVLVLILPVIGDRVIQNELDKRIDLVTSYGIEIKKNSEIIGYFTTKKHYEFLVKDADKFVKHYFKDFANAQMPPYLSAALGGVLIGVDFEYSNFPFSDVVEIDVYPLSLSTYMQKNIKTEDEEFYKYLDGVLASKGVLYHIVYNFSNEEFNGYLKNIDGDYTLKNGYKISLNILDAYFNGKGILIAPSRLNSTLKKFILEVTKGNSKFAISFEDISSSSSLENKKSFDNSVSLGRFKWYTKNVEFEDLEADFSSLNMHFSSNTKDEKAFLSLVSSFKTFDFQQKYDALGAYGFKCNASLKELDKESLQNLKILFSRAEAQQGKKINDEIEQNLKTLLSKGLVFKIDEFSLDKFTLNKKSAVKGFEFTMNLVLKVDGDFFLKLKNNLDELINDVTVDAKLRVSKEMILMIDDSATTEDMIKKYGKMDGDDVIYDIKFKQGVFSVNTKRVNY